MLSIAQQFLPDRPESNDEHLRNSEERRACQKQTIQLYVILSYRTETATEKLVLAMNDNRILLQLTAEIVAAHVSNNAVTPEGLPLLIRGVCQSLSGVDAPKVKPIIVPEPAVNPKKSVFNDYIICLEDGLKLKMLRRHLRAAYNMTPDQYRARWQLPPEYPMVAPSYAATRSALAKGSGLGRKRAPVAPISPAAVALRKKKVA